MEEEEENDLTKPARKIKCLSKESTCHSKSCEKVIECDDPVLSTHCYAITNDSTLALGNKTIVKPSDENLDIILAGCWTGGDECKSPAEIEAKLNKSLADASEHYTNLNKYKIPNSLLNESLQTGCISFSKSHDLNSYWSKHNRSFCCCSTNLCNRHIVFTSERNPHELFAEHLNPKVNAKTTTHSPSHNQNFHLLLNTGLLTGVLTFLLIFLFLLSFLVIYVIYKKKFKSKTPHLPAILFSKRTSSNNDDLNNSNHNQAINVNNTQAPLILNSSDTNIAIKQDNMLPPTSLNINKFNAELGYLSAQDDEDDFKNLAQPLLSQASVFPTSIIAPNVVISDQKVNKPPPPFFNKFELIDDLNEMPPPTVTIGMPSFREPGLGNYIKNLELEFIHLY